MNDNDIETMLQREREAIDALLRDIWEREKPLRDYLERVRIKETQAIDDLLQSMRRDDDGD